MAHFNGVPVELVITQPPAAPKLNGILLFHPRIEPFCSFSFSLKPQLVAGYVMEEVVSDLHRVRFKVFAATSTFQF